MAQSPRERCRPLGRTLTEACSPAARGHPELLLELEQRHGLLRPHPQVLPRRLRLRRAGAHAAPAQLHPGLLHRRVSRSDGPGVGGGGLGDAPRGARGRGGAQGAAPEHAGAQARWIHTRSSGRLSQPHGTVTNPADAVQASGTVSGRSRGQTGQNPRLSRLRVYRARWVISTPLRVKCNAGGRGQGAVPPKRTQAVGEWQACCLDTAGLTQPFLSGVLLNRRLYLSETSRPDLENGRDVSSSAGLL